MRPFLAAIFLGAIASPARSDILNVGDPAPKFAVDRFVQGEPFREFAKGKIYVVEFWATWCGPCRVSIPHLSALQKNHPDVTVVGVSFLESDPAEVPPFVREMGDRMTYRVATDSVPPGKEPEDGLMARGWMGAADEATIPLAFLVDGEGKIAWIGNPLGLDKPLEAVLAGKWDRDGERARRGREKDRVRRLTDALDAIEGARKLGEAPFLDAIATAERAGVALPPALVVDKLRKLALVDKARAIAYGEERIAGPYKDDALALQEIAWPLVAPPDEKVDPDLARFALKAALRADAVAAGKDAAIADTLAKAYFETGSADKAIAAQERAVRLGQAIEGADVSDLREALDRYRKAAGAK